MHKSFDATVVASYFHVVEATQLNCLSVQHGSIFEDDEPHHFHKSPQWVLS